MNRYTTIGTLCTWTIIGLWDHVDNKMLFADHLDDDLWQIAINDAVWYDPNAGRRIHIESQWKALK